MLVHWVASILDMRCEQWECHQGLDVGLLDTLARRTRKVALRSWGWEFSGINMYHDNGWWQPEIPEGNHQLRLVGSLGSHYLLKVLYGFVHHPTSGWGIGISWTINSTNLWADTPPTEASSRWRWKVGSKSLCGSYPQITRLPWIMVGLLTLGESLEVDDTKRWFLLCRGEMCLS